MDILDEQFTARNRIVLPPHLRKDTLNTMKLLKEQILSKVTGLITEKDSAMVLEFFQNVFNFLNMGILTLDSSELCFLIDNITKYIFRDDFYLPLLVFFTPIYSNLLSFAISNDCFDVIIDWRPVYQFIYKYTISNSKLRPDIPDPIVDTPCALISIALKLSYFFDGKEAQNIMNTFKEHVIHPKSSNDSNNLILLLAFLPVRNADPEIWLDFFFEQWSHWPSMDADTIFVPKLMIACNSGQKINWSKYIPFIFHRLSQNIGVPLRRNQNEDGNSKEDNFLSKEFMNLKDPSISQQIYPTVIIYLLTTEYVEEVKNHLEQLFHSLLPLYLPDLSETSDEPMGVYSFIDSLLERFLKTVKMQKQPNYKREKLSEETIRWFVKAVIELYGKEFYSYSDFLRELPYFIQVCPDITLPYLMSMGEQLSQYSHFRRSAAICFQLVSPLVFVKNYEVDRLVENTKMFVEDISSNDPELCMAVFYMYNLIFVLCDVKKLYGFDFIMTLLRRSVEFAATCVGEDLKQVKSNLALMLNSLRYHLKDEIKDEVEKYISEVYMSLPLSCIAPFIDKLSPLSMAKSLLKENPTDKDMKALVCLIRESPIFDVLSMQELADYLVKTVENEKAKIKKLGYSCVKWFLRSLVQTYPFENRVIGPQKLTEDFLKWHEPTEEDFDNGVKYAKIFFEKAKEIFNKTKGTNKTESITFIHAIINGLSGGVDAFCLGENRGLNIIYQKNNTSEKISKIFVEITDWLLDNLTEEQHPSIQSKIIDTLADCFAPIDVLGKNSEDIEKGFHELEPFLSLEYMLDSDNCMLANGIHLYAVKVLSKLFSSTQIPYTTFQEKIYEKIINFAASIHKSVSISVTSFVVDGPINENFRRQVSKFSTKAIKAFEKSVENGSNLSSSSTAANVMVATVSHSENGFDNYTNALLTLCTPVPKDDSGEVIHCAQYHLIDDFEMGLFSREDNYEKKLDFIKKLISKSMLYPVDSDIEIYTVWILRIIGQGIFDSELINYVLKHITSPELRTRSFAMQLLGSTIERLIPRIKLTEKSPFNEKVTEEKSNEKVTEETSTSKSEEKSNEKGTNDQKVTNDKTEKSGSSENDSSEVVDWDNFDSIEFDDNRPYLGNRKKAVILTPDVYKENVGKYFNERVSERIQIYNLLNETCNNEAFIKTTVQTVSDVRDHEELDIFQDHIATWMCLTKLFGPEFAIKALNVAKTFINKLNPEIVQFTGNEVIFGVIIGLTKFSSKLIKQVYDKLAEVLSKSYEIDGEFKWYEAISYLVVRKDPRRFFWLREILEKIEPPSNNSLTKKTRERVDLLKSLILLCCYDKESLLSLLPRFTDIFDSKCLSLDYSRKLVVGCCIDFLIQLNNLDLHNEIEDFFYENIMSCNDDFICDFIQQAFSEASGLTYFLYDLVANNIESVVSDLENKDLDDINDMQASVMTFLDDNPKFDKDQIQELFEGILEQFAPTPDLHWSTQCLRICLVMMFIMNNIYLIDPVLIQNYLGKYIIKFSIFSNNPNVGEAAMLLLKNCFKNIKYFEHLKRKYVDEFREKLINPDPIVKSDKKDSKNKSKSSQKSTMKRDKSEGQIIDPRIGPIRGLMAISLSETIIDKVSDEVFDALTAIVEYSEINQNLNQLCTRFFSAFWQRYNDNLTSEAAEKLSPFVFAIKPTYIA